MQAEILKQMLQFKLNTTEPLAHFKLDTENVTQIGFNFHVLLKTYSPLDSRISLVESLNNTPTLLSHSWYPRPYLSE